MSVDETIRLTEIVTAPLLGALVCEVTELGVPDQIDPGSARAVAEIASAVNCDERTLYRVMRFLASHGIFEERNRGEFALTPPAALLRSDTEDSFYAAARMFKRLFPALEEVGHSLRTGGSALTKKLGVPLFEFMMDHPDDAAIFDAAMTSFHGPEGGAMLDAYDFSGIGILADVGGGNGTLLIQMLQRHSALGGMLFDLEHVVERAKKNLQSAGVLDRCKLQAGSFFDSIPSGADAYLLRHIIHDWSDEDSVRILRNCRKAVSQDGRLLIVEPVVPEGNDPSPAKDMDMTMLVYPGGMERTAQEYGDLFEASGFRLATITPTASPVSIIEGRPK